MSSIVLEFQKELIDKNYDILQVLRKAHLIAFKLNLNEFDKWIQNELNGYKGEDENFPDYRQVKGTLKAKNPYRGWIRFLDLLILRKKLKTEHSIIYILRNSQ